MLLWQRKNVPKLAFGAQLSLAIVLMHAVALLLLCIHSVAVHDELCVDVSRSYVIGADIVVVPFQKTIKQLPAAAPQPVVQEAQRDTTVIKDVQKPAKPEPKKVESVKSAREKSVAEEPIKNEQKVEPVKPAQPEPLSKEKVVEQSKVVEKKVTPIPQATKPAVSSAQTQPTPQYIGTRQLQTMQIQRAIVEQVQMHWHPPEGLEQDLEVVLAIHIDNNGDVTDVDTQQSSGVFAYDVHARSAVYEMQFPKPCWGKTITIAFK